MNLENKRGIFPWYTLVTSDTQKATDFYTKLFNWETMDFEIPKFGKTTLFANSDGPFCDLTPTNKSELKTTMWMNYISVDNVDDVCNRAKKFGAKIIGEAFDMPTIGRSALIQDSFGAHFMPYTPEDPDKMQTAMGQNEGNICWNELMVKNPKEAVTFYSEIFGWKFEGNEDGSYFHFKASPTDQHGLGGILKTPPEAANMPSTWMVYFKTEDLDKKTLEAEKLGAKIIMKRTEIPKTGYFTMIQDPTGGMSYLFEYMS